MHVTPRFHKAMMYPLESVLWGLCPQKVRSFLHPFYWFKFSLLIKVNDFLQTSSMSLRPSHLMLSTSKHRNRCLIVARPLRVTQLAKTWMWLSRTFKCNHSLKKTTSFQKVCICLFWKVKLFIMLSISRHEFIRPESLVNWCNCTWLWRRIQWEQKLMLLLYIGLELYTHEV